MTNHLDPDNCHICGHTERAHTENGHSFWSNRDADAEAARMDRGRIVRYSSGAATADAAYVAEHRPY